MCATKVQARTSPPCILRNKHIWLKLLPICQKNNKTTHRVIFKAQKVGYRSRKYRISSTRLLWLQSLPNFCTILRMRIYRTKGCLLTSGHKSFSNDPSSFILWLADREIIVHPTWEYTMKSSRCCFSCGFCWRDNNGAFFRLMWYPIGPEVNSPRKMMIQQWYSVRAVSKLFLESSCWNRDKIPWWSLKSSTQHFSSYSNSTIYTPLGNQECSALVLHSF